jgi:hypothetical protein
VRPAIEQVTDLSLSVDSMLGRWDAASVAALSETARVPASVLRALLGKVRTLAERIEAATKRGVAA